MATKQILVIEDDGFMRDTLVDQLEDEGYIVHGASSVDDGLSAASKCEFDILVTDVRMAKTDGITGFELLKERLPKLKCIVITGYASDKDAAKAIRIEVDDFLRKPFNLVDLTSAVHRVANENSIKAKYYDLIHKVPIKVINYAAKFFLKDKNAPLENARNKAFKALYTAIKSHLIASANTANALFTALCEYEEDYRSQLDSPSQERFDKLLGNYAEVTERVASLQRTTLPLLRGKMIELAHFRPFFEQIRDAKVDEDEFFLAPILLALNRSEIRKDERLLKIHDRLWPHRAA